MWQFIRIMKRILTDMESWRDLPWSHLSVVEHSMSPSHFHRIIIEIKAEKVEWTWAQKASTKDLIYIEHCTEWMWDVHSSSLSTDAPNCYWTLKIFSLYPSKIFQESVASCTKICLWYLSSLLKIYHSSKRQSWTLECQYLESKILYYVSFLAYLKDKLQFL